MQEHRYATAYALPHNIPSSMQSTASELAEYAFHSFHIQHVSSFNIMAFMKETMIKTYSGLMETMVESEMGESMLVCHTFNIQHAPIGSQGHLQLFHL